MSDGDMVAKQHGDHGEEVGVDWASGLVLHEHDATWHPWDESVYGLRPGATDREMAL